MATIRHGKQVRAACLLLWLAISPPALADTVYRCPDARAKTTIFQDRPCEIQAPATVASLPVAVVVSAPASIPQAIIAPAEPAKPEPALQPESEPDTDPLRLVWLALLAAALLILSGAVLWLWLHGKRRPAAQGWETQSLLILPETPAKPDSWTLPLLQSLEWKRFENLCIAYYRSTGLRAEPTPPGPEGGADIHLYQGDESAPQTIVRCKAWLRDVGLDEVRALHEVQLAEKTSQSVLIGSNNFSKEAIAFARENGMTLLDGRALLALLRGMPQAQSRQLRAWATEGDYLTPSCPVCGQKMSEREGSRGLFWGCRGYPLCKGKLSIHGAPA